MKTLCGGVTQNASVTDSPAGNEIKHLGGVLND